VLDFVLGKDLGQEIPDMMDLGKPLEDGYEASMLALGGGDIHDIVVEVILSCRGSYGVELGTGWVDEDGPEAPDFGSHMHCHQLKE